MNPLWSHQYVYDTDGVVTVVEDELKVAAPNQKLCFGDEFTTCSAIIVILQNNWKVAAHINPFNYTIQGTYGTPIQIQNPVTVLQNINRELTTNPNLRNSTIKKIYAVTSLGGGFKIMKRANRRTYTTNFNNNTSSSIRFPEENLFRYSETLSNSNKRAFFSTAFPGKVTPQTQIEIHIDKEVEHGRSGGVHHFFVLENGDLDLVSWGRP